MSHHKMKRIAFISDIHLNEQFPVDHGIDSKRNWERVLEDLKSKNIDDIIYGGDIGDHTAHQWFFETIKPFRLKLILGNHDHFQQVSNHFRAGNDPDELYYQFEDTSHTYLFLDSSSGIISSKQLQWLTGELQTNKKILLFVHHPVIGINTPVDRLYPLKNREEVKLILKNSSNEVTLFCGHYHMNDEVIEDNIRQIITQASSYQIVKVADNLQIDHSRFGYRMIDVDSNHISTTCVNFESNT
jgi:3',5'-cyclic AMP phosphodiesterase CpdA